MIEIYYFDIESISEYQLQKAYSWISEDRKKKARRYKFRDDEKRCVFGEALVRYGLLKKGYEKDISIFHNSFGKPYMGKNDIFFNISHAGNWVSVAFSDDEIGIDIEKKIYDEDVLLQFTKTEIDYVKNGNLEKVAERFTEIWTKKESYIKYLGLGMSKDFLSFSTVGYQKKVMDMGNIKEVIVNTYKPFEGYFFSICMAGKIEEIFKKTLYFIDLENMFE